MSSSEPPSEWRAGGRTLASAFVGVGAGTGLLIMTAGLFIIPMENEFGWSRRALSIGPLILFFSSLMQPFAGALIDRFGARRIAIIGLLALTSLYPMLAASPANPWIFYFLVALLTLITPIANGVALVKGVATWFKKNSGLAFGVVMSGTSVSAALALPWLAQTIEKFGWRMGYLLLALVSAAGLVVVLLWFRERPPPVANPPAGQGSDAARSQQAAMAHAGVTLREALRDKRYWLLILALGGAALPIGGFVSQLQPLLVSHRLSPVAAASAGTVFALAIASARILAGSLLDRRNPSVVAAACLALPALGVLVLLINAGAEPSWMLAAFAVVLLGLGQGAETDFIAFFTLRLFGLRSFSLIFGTVQMVVGGGMAIGGLLFATVFDFFGTYQPALYVSIAIYVIAACVMLRIDASESPEAAIAPEPPVVSTPAPAAPRS